MKRTFLISMAAVFALASCNVKESQMPVVKTDAEMAISPVQGSSNALTKGYVETAEFAETYLADLHNGGEAVARTMQLSAYLYPQNGDARNYFVGSEFTKSESDYLWHADPAAYWPVGGKMDFLAYSVSSETEGPGAAKAIKAVWNEENAAEQVVLTVPAENSQNDILFASVSNQKCKSESSPVGMVFNHAQTWLEFVLTGNVDEDQPVVHFKRIELENAYNAGTLTISNNGGNALAQWSFAGEKAQNIAVDNFNKVKDLNEAPQYLDMLIPQQEKTAFVIYYTLGDNDQELSYRFTTDQKTWLMGEKYIYGINITANEITVDPIVAEWSENIETTYTISLKSNNDEWGSASFGYYGGETETVFMFGEEVYISAYASEGFAFLKWSDGNTEQQDRKITVTGDATYEAIFTDETCSLKVWSEKSVPCTWHDPNDVPEDMFFGERVTYLIPGRPSRVWLNVISYFDEKYSFMRWGDGSTDNPRTFCITEDTSIEAIFGIHINVTSSDANRGTVTGDGIYEFKTGSTADLHAEPKPGYKFYKWNVYQYESTTLCGEIYDADITVSVADERDYVAYFIPEDALPGTFSINSDGGEVVFAEGNLQATYNNSTWTWGFAKNQQDCIGGTSGNVSISSPYNGMVVDLFSWSTPSSYFGITATNNPSTLKGSFVDWGTNKLSGKSGSWRTYSKEEWEYLLNERTVNGGKGLGYSYSMGTTSKETVYIQMHPVYGIFIYPDNYSGPLAGKAGMETWSDINKNGILFLPAAGSRMGEEMHYDVNSRCCYWTSTEGAAITSYGLNSSSVTLGKYQIHIGMSVRLISDFN